MEAVQSAEGADLPAQARAPAREYSAQRDPALDGVRGLAMLMFHALELPLLGLKERGPGRRSTAPAAVDASP